MTGQWQGWVEAARSIGVDRQWQRALVVTGIGNVAVAIQVCVAEKLQKKVMADGLTIDWEYCLMMLAEEKMRG